MRSRLVAAVQLRQLKTSQQFCDRNGSWTNIPTISAAARSRDTNLSVCRKSPHDRPANAFLGFVDRQRELLRLALVHSARSILYFRMVLRQELRSGPMTYGRIETLAEGVELWLGDCREILPSLGKVDAVVTDPPFEEEAHTLGRRLLGRSLGNGERELVTDAALSFPPIDEKMRRLVARE